MAFSLVLLGFIIDEITPIKIVGEPIAAFFAMLMFYFVGWKSVLFYLGTLSFLIVVQINSVFAYAQFLQKMLSSLFTYGITLTFNSPKMYFSIVLPEKVMNAIAFLNSASVTILLTIGLSSVVFCASFMSLLFCRWIIKKTKIVARLQGIKI
jgi:hypothetical protein